MPAPTFVSATAKQTGSGSGSINPGLPAGWQPDDILILLIQTANNSLYPNVGGYTNLCTVAAHCGFGTKDAANTSRLDVLWKRAVAGETAFNAGSGTVNHWIAQCLAFRGCVKTGSPFDAALGEGYYTLTWGSMGWAGSLSSRFANNVAAATLATTVNDCLCISIMGHATDSNSAWAGTLSWSYVATPALFTGCDVCTNVGVGGGLHTFGGVKSTAGTIADLSAGPGYNKAGTGAMVMMVVALKPEPPTTYLQANSGAFNEAGNTAGLLENELLVGGLGGLALAGAAAFMGKQRTMPVASGSFTEAGNAAALLRARLAVGGKGTYNESGNAAGIVVRRALLGNTGAFAETGSPAELTKIAAALVYKLAGLSGSFAALVNSRIDDSYNVQTAASTVYAGTSEAVGQTFVSNGGKLLAVRFVLRKNGAPTGNILAALTSVSGGLPVANLAVSDPVDIATLRQDFDWVQFNFSGAAQYNMVAGTPYCVDFYYPSGDSVNNLGISFDNVTHTHPGDLLAYQQGTGLWTNYGAAGNDLAFSVYVESTARLLKASRAVGGTGSFALAGNAARLLAARRLAASKGTFIETGNPAELTKIGLALVYYLAGLTGVYNEAGAAARLLGRRQAVGGTGSFAAAGSAARLLAARRMAGSRGTFTLAGGAAGAVVRRLLGAGTGAFAESGAAARLLRACKLVLNTGTFTEAGAAARLQFARLLAGGKGIFIETGSSAFLFIDFPAEHNLLVAGTGVFLEAGSSASLLARRMLAASKGTFTESGNAARLLRALKAAGQTGAYTEAGGSAALFRLLRLAAGKGTFTEAGASAFLLRRFPMAASGGTFTESGAAAQLLGRRLIIGSRGVFTESGSPAGMQRLRPLAASGGVFIESGAAAKLLRARLLPGVEGIFRLFGDDAELTHGGLIIFADEDICWVALQLALAVNVTPQIADACDVRMPLATAVNVQPVFEHSSEIHLPLTTMIEVQP